SLAEVEAQMQELAANAVLSAEQLAVREQLGARQAERRAELARARDDRSRILYEARAEEADLQVRRDDRDRERGAAGDGAGGRGRDGAGRGRGRDAAGYAVDPPLGDDPDHGRYRGETGPVRPGSSNDPGRYGHGPGAEEDELQAWREDRRRERDSRGGSGERRDREDGRGRDAGGHRGRYAARDELAELAREQREAAAMEDQLTGLLTVVHRQVAENLDDADKAIEALREFVDAPVFDGGRGGRARREMAQEVADTLETVVQAERDRGGAARQRIGELEDRVRTLEEGERYLLMQISVLQDVLGVEGDVPFETLISRTKALVGLPEEPEVGNVVRGRRGREN
ncbi:MAG: hypothetical protein FWD88_07625, partial [Treponema sp.]|nr:hypothetical protein [Treponema sp.]